MQSAAWKAGLVDAVHVYVAPMILGAGAVSWLDSDTVSIASLLDRRVTPLGPDVFMEGHVHGIE